MPGNQPIQSFLNYLQFEKRYSQHTLISYTTDLRDFQDFLITNYDGTPVIEATTSIIRSWLAFLKNEENLQAKSIARKISSLRSFYKYQLKTGALAITPMQNISVPKTGKRLPVFVKENETQQLLETLSIATESWDSLNAKMLFVIFYNTGMRLSELINLKEKQLDLGRSAIKVLGKGNKERVIPVSKEVVDVIKDYQRQKKKTFAPEHDYFLVNAKGKKLYPRYAYKLINQHLKQAATLDKKSPHVLRHTFATHLMNAGADLSAVKELLGHASLASTQVYTHNTIEKLKEVHKKAHPKA